MLRRGADMWLEGESAANATLRCGGAACFAEYEHLVTQ